MHEGKCSVCETEAEFDQLFAVLKINETARSLIHEFKYREYKYIGEFLGKLIFELIKDRLIHEKFDIIAPVPLHKVKKRIRGFNQSEIIAKAISRYSGIPLIADLLKRTVYTDTQTKLSKEERKLNVSEAFTVNKKYDVKDKKIIIVDDVFTTGSTMNAVCGTLKRQNVKKSVALTIVRA